MHRAEQEFAEPEGEEQLVEEDVFGSDISHDEPMERSVDGAERSNTQLICDALREEIRTRIEGIPHFLLQTYTCSGVSTCTRLL